MEPYEECPSFIRCNCNVCPLDPDQDEKNKIPEDEKCRAEKPTRMRIGEKYAHLLPMKGLTSREYAGRKVWDAKSVTEQNKCTQRLAKWRKTLENRC